MKIIQQKFEVVISMWRYICSFKYQKNNSSHFVPEVQQEPFCLVKINKAVFWLAECFPSDEWPSQSQLWHHNLPVSPGSLIKGILVLPNIYTGPINYNLTFYNRKPLDSTSTQRLVHHVALVIGCRNWGRRKADWTSSPCWLWPACHQIKLGSCCQQRCPVPSSAV